MNENSIELRIKNVCENYTENTIGGWITGDGPIPSTILFVGEAPGKKEVEQNKPFIGMAGETFEKHLNSIGLNRLSVRITNTCFFRPIKIKTNQFGKKTISNRTPKVSEIKLFKEILDDEVKLVNPKIIVTLGNIPLKRFTSETSIGSCHGKLLYNNELKKHIFPMYHPSALTYNRNDEFLNMYKSDWKKLKEVLNSF